MWHLKPTLDICIRGLLLILLPLGLVQVGSSIPYVMRRLPVLELLLAALDDASDELDVRINILHLLGVACLRLLTVDLKLPELLVQCLDLLGLVLQVLDGGCDLGLATREPTLEVVVLLGGCVQAACLAGPGTARWSRPAWSASCR